MKKQVLLQKYYEHCIEKTLNSRKLWFKVAYQFEKMTSKFSLMKKIFEKFDLFSQIKNYNITFNVCITYKKPWNNTISLSENMKNNKENKESEFLSVLELMQIKTQQNYFFLIFTFISIFLIAKTYLKKRKESNCAGMHYLLSLLPITFVYLVKYPRN